MRELTLRLCLEKRTLSWDMTEAFRILTEVLDRFFFLGGYGEYDQADRQKFQGKRFWCDVRKNFLTIRTAQCPRFPT